MKFKYEDQVLDFLRKNNGWIGATNIGIGIGFDYHDASAKCYKSLKNLKSKGLIEQESHKTRGRYRAI